jgi:hypothetical protein
MRNTLACIICTTLIGVAGSFGEGRIPYAPVVKKAMLKTSIDIEGEQYVRVFMKPQSDDTKIESVIITIERDGKILKTIKPTICKLPENVSPDEDTWEILLPIDKEYLKDTELVHNQEPGTLNLEIKYAITLPK